MKRIENPITRADGTTRIRQLAGHAQFLEYCKEIGGIGESFTGIPNLVPGCPDHWLHDATAFSGATVFSGGSTDIPVERGTHVSLKGRWTSGLSWDAETGAPFFVTLFEFEEDAFVALMIRET